MHITEHRGYYIGILCRLSNALVLRGTEMTGGREGGREGGKKWLSFDGWHGVNSHDCRRSN